MARRKQDKPSEERGSAKNFTMAITVRLTKVESYRIRRYEEGGLLAPERTPGNQRLFSECDIEIIKQAARLEDEGINVEGVRVILAMRRGERR